MRAWMLVVLAGLVANSADGALPAAPAPSSETCFPRETVSPMRAREYSILCTVVPVVAGIMIPLTTDATTRSTIASGSLIWSGALVGPAIGYLRGGAGRQALPGLLIRAAAFGSAWAIGPTHDFDDGFFPNPEFDVFSSSDPVPYVWGAAILAIAISDIVDIIQVPRAVRKAQLTGSVHHSRLLPLVDPVHRRLGVTICFDSGAPDAS